MRGRKPKEKPKTVLTDFKKDEKLVNTVYVGGGRSLKLIRFTDIFRNIKYMVVQVDNGTSQIIAVRDGENAAYQIFHRLEKKYSE